jgi:hypothetical protein
VRFAEIALLVLPFVVFVAWRLLAPTAAGPPKVLVIAVAATVVAMAALLLLLWYEEAEPPDAGYVPARLENGRVVPERVEPPVPGSVRQGTAAPGTAAPGAAAPSGPVRK